MIYKGFYDTLKVHMYIYIYIYIYIIDIYRYPICQPWHRYIYRHDWVSYFGQMLGFIFQHHGSHIGKGKAERSEEIRRGKLQKIRLDGEKKT